MRLLLGGLFLLSVLLLAFGLRLQREGREALAASDAAFHQGDLKEAVRAARKAGLAFVPGSPTVRAARERLLAIARGAEASGDDRLARRAWDALRTVELRTDYPGRPASEAAALAEEGLRRVDARLSRAAPAR